MFPVGLVHPNFFSSTVEPCATILSPLTAYSAISTCMFLSERCGRKRGLVRRYNLHLCRQCFREIAPDLGFEKYS